MSQFQRALRTMDAQSHAVMKLGDTLKTEILMLGPPLRNHGDLFERRLTSKGPFCKQKPNYLTFGFMHLNRHLSAVVAPSFRSS
jgi:hypothetical protein